MLSNTSKLLEQNVWILKYAIRWNKQTGIGSIVVMKHGALNWSVFVSKLADALRLDSMTVENERSKGYTVYFRNPNMG